MKQRSLGLGTSTKRTRRREFLDEMDRVVHHAVTLNIRGNSYRLKEKLKAGLVRSDESDPQPGGEI